MFIRQTRVLGSHTIQVAGLYVATLLGTALGVVSSVINTRFLEPADYGDVRYIQNILNFICSILFIGHFYAGSRFLAISNSKDYSRELRGSMAVLLLAVSVLCIVGTMICAAVHSSDRIKHLLLLSCSICMEPLFLSYINNVLQGDNHIWRIALARFLPTAIYLVIAWPIFATLGGNSESMLLIQWGSAMLVFLLLIVSTGLDFNNVKKGLKVLHTGNIQFGRKIYFGVLVTTGVNYLAGITLGIFNVDNTVAGYYTLALTVTFPLSLLPAIISTSIFKNMASRDNIPPQVYIITVIATIVTCLLFLLIIKPVVVMFYTERYLLVGEYAQYLAVAACLHGLGDFIKGFLTAHGLGKGIENSCIFSGIVKLVGFFILVYYFNIMGAIVTLIVGEVVYFCSLLYYYKKREVNS